MLCCHILSDPECNIFYAYCWKHHLLESHSLGSLTCQVLTGLLQLLGELCHPVTLLTTLRLRLLLLGQLQILLLQLAMGPSQLIHLLSVNNRGKLLRRYSTFRDIQIMPIDSVTICATRKGTEGMLQEIVIETQSA